MERGGAASGCSIKVSYWKFITLPNQTSDGSLRRAKKKLPGEVKKKVEEWKFSSGAVVMCLVAYSDGQDVHSFQ
jgi:hypothetical protein